VRGEQAGRNLRAAERQDRQPAQSDRTGSTVLVAGEESSRRAKMLEELRGLLPGGTLFVEARETWQVLARAADSRMVILTGDLGDISAQGLMRVLSRRHPLLPVIALGLARRSTRANGRQASADSPCGAVPPRDLGAASL
jgi:hypothetical protein